MTSIDPRQHHVRVRIKNVKSGRYLSIEGDETNWGREDASLSIRDWMEEEPVLESPQIWNIIKYRDEEWIMLNQYSKYLACIRGRSTGNGATAIQYPAQFLPTDPFQEWNFKQLDNGNFLIGNDKSKKFLGPYYRETTQDTYIIQYDDQTSEDNYQEWVFEEM
jgi:hypothetical protein